VYIALEVLGVNIARNVSIRLQRIDPSGRHGGPEQDGCERREHLLTDLLSKKSTASSQPYDYSYRSTTGNEHDLPPFLFQEATKRIHRIGA
jgi:hypothetical protein